MKKSLFVVICAVFAMIHAESAKAEAQSASTTCNVNANVYPAIAITKNQDLNFNGGVAGDPSKTIAVTDTTDSAKFTVTGGTSAAYNITLPSSVTIITGAGGANQTIVVNAFNSSIGTSGNTGVGASQSFYMGATRAALGASQVTGSYTGTATVTVQYQ